MATKQAIFSLGNVSITGTLHHCIRKAGMEELVTLMPYLERHMTGDWGEVDKQDARTNAQAVKSGARILSAYDVPKIGRIWIITDAAWTSDIFTRQQTTVMFPSDY